MSNSSQGEPSWAPDSRFSGLRTFLHRFRGYTWDVAGVLLIAVSLMTLLASIHITGGSLLSPWVEILKRWFGWGSYVIVVSGGVIGFFFIRRRRDEDEKIYWGRIISLEITVFAFLALLSIIAGHSLERAEAGLDGGLVGWGLADLVTIYLGNFWSGVIFFLITLFAGIVGLGLIPRVYQWISELIERDQERDKGVLMPDPAVSVAPTQDVSISVQEEEQPTKKRRVRLPAEYRKDLLVPLQSDQTKAPPPRGEHLPSYELLVSEKTRRPDERNINLTAGLIEKTLDEFGIPAKVVGFKQGPTITQFAIEPGYVEKTGQNDEISRQKVRVSQISALARDLALALSAERLRIQAPVPGRSYVGIEVPNSRSVVVRLRPVMESDAFYKIKSPLAIALGRDVSGHPVVADLSRMPHLLIAGTTGSGKSVCIAALTTCLVMNNTPDELRIVMIDPKKVELVRFNGMPHLFGKVETDLERITGVLHWVTFEMDRRYRLLEELRARNIDSYNRKARRRKDIEPIPRIVVMIDELADLMMIAAEQTEHTLVRLAQMARATGIHLVLATQRPSTDVVTGLIKANFPARMSFAVASSVDSRVILDTPGAETLLGKGDLLFIDPESGIPLRAQGVMVSDQEVERVITFWQSNWEMESDESAPWESYLKEMDRSAKRDELVERAIDIIRTTGKASASMLQRRLRIGYPRAARLMDELEVIGVVGPPMGGGKEREILINVEEDDVESEDDA